MKILYHHRTASKDGQYVHIQELICSLKSLGHEVVVVGPVSKRVTFGGVSSGVANLRARLPASIYEVLELGYAMIDMFKMCAAVVRCRPDIIYERYNLLLPSGIWVKQLFGLPLLLEVNAPLYEERAAHSDLKFHRLAAWSQYYVWTNADRVLAVTGVMKNMVEKAGVEQSKIHVIPNGVDPIVFRPRPVSEPLRDQFGLKGRTVVGFVGFAREWHGLDRVAHALSAAPGLDWHFLVVGDGPATAPLMRLAVKLGCADRITITGLVERDRIAEHISLFDIAVQSDVVDYASPLKLFEYMAMGKAILAIDRPNIREVLSDGIDCLMFPPDDAPAFATALQRLCSDATLREKLGAGALRTIIDRRYYWTANASRVERIASKLIDERSRVANGKL